MRILGIVLILVGVLLLGDQLLGLLARPVGEPGGASQLVGPALFLVLGLWLLQKGQEPKNGPTDPSTE